MIIEEVNGDRKIRGKKRSRSVMYSLGSCSHGNRRRRGLNQVGRCRGDIAITSALLTGNGTASIEGIRARDGQGGFGITIAALENTVFVRLRIQVSGLESVPGRQLPGNSGETAQFQWLSVPLAAWSAGTIKGAQARVDSTGVGLRSDTVVGCWFGSVYAALLTIEQWISILIVTNHS